MFRRGGQYTDEAGGSSSAGGPPYGRAPAPADHNIGGPQRPAQTIPLPAAPSMADADQRLKARIMTHPLFEQLLSAHVACLRVATPVQQFHHIDSALLNSDQVAAKYQAYLAAEYSSGTGLPYHHESSQEELDHFMMSYTLLLRSLKEHLEENMTAEASEAISACLEIEHALQDLTGVCRGKETELEVAPLMPHDDDLQRIEDVVPDLDIDFGDHNNIIPHFVTGDFPPHGLIQDVRRELKNYLKEDYMSKLKDAHDKIVRKRRSGTSKLSKANTDILEAWQASHPNSEYPTEEEKEMLAKKTGLQLKQVENWFLQQEKRSFHG